MDRSVVFRKQMKEQDPERYKEYLYKQKVRVKERREQLKKELQKKNPNPVAKQKKAHELQLQRERQRRYLEKKRQMNGSINTPLKSVRKPAVETRHSIQAKRDYNRVKKREERAKMSYQKRMWNRKKDRERKAKSRMSKKASICVTSQSTSPFKTKKTEWNITSKVRAMMPETPKKFAKVLDNIEKRATPRKRQALNDLKDDLAKKKMVEKKEDMKTVNSPKQKNNEKSTKIQLSSDKPAARLYLAKRAMLKRKSRVDVKGIQMFYLREDISRILPQKRFATKEGPGYAMQVSVKTAHAKYNFENHKNVSLGKFAALRKRNVRLLSLSHRDYCCCPYCTNIRFKLLTLSRVSPDQKCKKTNENDIVDILLCPKADSEQFYDAKCINGGCNQCFDYEKTLKEFYNQIPEDKILTWNRWTNDTNSDNGMVKKVVITEKGSKNKLIQEMVEKDIKKPAQGYTFFQHFFTAQWQNKQFKQIKANLPAGSVLQVMDFAKNRQIKYQSEIKGAFFTARQVTMHPVVTYFQSDVGLVRNSSIIISEDNCHDYHAVNHFAHIVNSHIEKIIEKPKRRIIFSDGCSAQYKSKGPFADIANERIEINRNYFGSEHGKSECDGEIGVLNRSLDRAIIGNKVVLNSAEDVYNYCQSHLKVDDVLSTRNFFYVKNGEIDRNRPETDVKTVPSTRKFHQILNSTKEPGLLSVRSLSCFCKKCESGDSVICLNRKYVEKYAKKQLQRNEVTVVNTEENGANPAVPEVNSEKHHESKSPEKLESPVINPYSRQDYFQMILSKMCLCESFGDLQIIVPEIEDEVRELYGDINFNPDINVVSHGLTVDRVAHKQPLNNRTVEATLGKFPVCVQGDGNCLPRSGSILSFGDEDHHTEIRCRIVIEMVTNIDLYLSDEHLKNGTVLVEKEARQLVKTYAMFSEHYIPGTRLVPRTIFKKEVMEACKDKTYMGIWHIFALSSVLHCQLFSMYPQLGSELYSTTLNRLIIPKQDDGSGIGNIMWSSTRQDMTASNWIPNHFVPVVNTTVPESASFVEELFEEDNELPELDSSTFNSIWADLNYEELLNGNAAIPDVNMQEDVEAGQSVSSVSEHLKTCGDDLADSLIEDIGIPATKQSDSKHLKTCGDDLADSLIEDIGIPATKQSDSKHLKTCGDDLADSLIEDIGIPATNQSDSKHLKTCGDDLADSLIEDIGIPATKQSDSKNLKTCGDDLADSLIEDIGIPATKQSDSKHLKTCGDDLADSLIEDIGIPATKQSDSKHLKTCGDDLADSLIEDIGIPATKQSDSKHLKTCGDDLADSLIEDIGIPAIKQRLFKPMSCTERRKSMDCGSSSIRKESDNYGHWRRNLSLFVGRISLNKLLNLYCLCMDLDNTTNFECLVYSYT
ncbi:LOW QUALITY PROTEIN: uncharacterized protein LOC132731228 [Ruditapes philippinarum]|uniref:LOW QUALITY PROTEIN: uncharacterized protein LOC132731228 n=1 Tax=Ruditapes philippinarum TaxID=129788 RepID=UPI00295B9CBD|nr:LOW QUALITY PROTEIN: uncharacterized protein LOC132731228 [Ruditapes philippinarum]